MNAVRVIFLLVVGFVFCVAGAVRGQDIAGEAAGVPSVADAPVVADGPVVADAPVAIKLTVEPAQLRVVAGERATFLVTASGVEGAEVDVTSEVVVTCSDMSLAGLELPGVGRLGWRFLWKWFLLRKRRSLL